jgi:PAS domain S-box-containing protein
MNRRGAWESQREAIIGFGENSNRKSYYPELQNKIRELEITREELLQSERNLTMLFNAMPDALFIHTLEGKVLHANKAMFKLYGVTESNYKNYSIANYSAPNQTALELVYTELVEKGELLFEWKAMCPMSGETFSVEVSLRPFNWYGEQAVVAVVRDITERKAADVKAALLKEQLHQSQKMEAIGQLAGRVAHDFNNALGGIIGATELLRSESLRPEEKNEYIELILTASGRAADLTRKLLTFSHKANKANRAIDCNQIIRDTVSLLRHTIDKNIVVSTSNRATKLTVIGDDSLLQNAIMNMGINASHAMPDGGELTFTLENLELNREYCEVSPFDIKPGEYLAISISDTGVGMSADVVSRIFEPFFTTKEAGKGTGLGLAAAYGTVQEHGGAITVYSEPGAGTVFNIYLPVSAETVRREPESGPNMVGSGTILVIDDEELIRVTTSAMLRSLGYRVILATNGQEGIETFLKANDEIDLILLDMIMPVMEGPEAFAKLREIDPKIPIVIASGFAQEEDMVELKRQGACGFLDKPFSRAELAKMMGLIISPLSS